MPVNGSSASSSNAPGGANRTTFRPPWVKEGPQPIPMPAQGQAWRRDSSSLISIKIKQIKVNLNLKFSSKSYTKH